MKDHSYSEGRGVGERVHSVSGLAGRGCGGAARRAAGRPGRALRGCGGMVEAQGLRTSGGGTAEVRAGGGAAARESIENTVVTQ